MTYDNPVKSASCEGRHIQLDLSSTSRKDKDKLPKGPVTSDSLIFPVLLTWKNQGHTSSLNEKRWECSLSCQLLCLSYPTRASRQWIQTMFPYIFHWDFSPVFPVSGWLPAFLLRGSTMIFHAACQNTNKSPSLLSLPQLFSSIQAGLKTQGHHWKLMHSSHSNELPNRLFSLSAKAL